MPATGRAGQTLGRRAARPRRCSLPGARRRRLGVAGRPLHTGAWGRQDQLVEAIAAARKPIITLLLAGRALAVPRLAEISNAMFMGRYMGQEAGNAFADFLFGEVAPGGKLAVSMPRSVGELPIYYNRHRSSDLNRYLEGERNALFPSAMVSATRSSKSGRRASDARTSVRVRRLSCKSTLPTAAANAATR